MRLQWETDYAMRCVLCLAGKYEGWTPVTELAQEMKVPEQMARKMVSRLCAAGILDGKPGPKGGVRLARAPGEISVYDVVACVEGELYINRCLQDTGLCSRNGAPHCTVHRYLKGLQDQIEHSMRSMTFESLLDDHGGAGPEAAHPSVM